MSRRTLSIRSVLYNDTSIDHAQNCRYWNLRQHVREFSKRLAITRPSRCLSDTFLTKIEPRISVRRRICGVTKEPHDLRRKTGGGPDLQSPRRPMESRRGTLKWASHLVALSAESFPSLHPATVSGCPKRNAAFLSKYSICSASGSFHRRSFKLLQAKRLGIRHL
jgi:hypothetical protein